ncbi:hypothetical protein [Lentisalinibacter sediminis]|uniref:hypothetical protein n=2 Tax=Lentisalinibacter sediminis TaxID=2992237 RepID=UPI0038689ADB
MSASTGNSSPEKKSGVIEPSAELTRTHLMLLLGLGAAIVLLREVFRIPLGLPGHHGVEAMALLATARFCTDHRWGATIAAMGAALTAGAIGAGHGGLFPALYLLPGLVIDTGAMLVPGWRRRLLWIPLFAALGHATKPVVKWFALGGTDVHMGSMVNGLPYPLTTHLLFGFTGALVATLGWRALEKRSSSS